MMGGWGGEALSLSGRLGGGVVFVCLEKVVQQRACVVFLVAGLFCLGR